MRCVRCGTEMTAGAPCPACGTRVVHVRDTGDPEPVIRLSRASDPPRVRRPSGIMPRLHDAEGSRGKGGSKPYVVGLLLGVTAAALLVLYLSPHGDVDGGGPPDAAAESGSDGEAARRAPVADAAGNVAVPEAVAALAPAVAAPAAPAMPSAPSAVPAATPPIAPSPAAPATPLPAVPPAVAALAERPTAPPVATVGVLECPVAACVPEGGAWEVADRARRLLDEDPSVAACWAMESVRLGRRFSQPAITASGYYHLGVALQRMGCRSRAHLAYFHSICIGKRSTNPHLLGGYVESCERTGDGCEDPCDSAAAAGDPVPP